MIGRVSSVGMIDYTASYDGEKLYLYEQSKLVAEREIKGFSGVVFEGNVIYYTMEGNNIIFAETVLGHTLNNYHLNEFKEVVVYKKLSDNEFIIAAEGTDGDKVIIYDLESGKSGLELPCDSFHDFVYDGKEGFRLSGHRKENISIYEDDCDYKDILYGEYNVSSSGEITEKCHFGVSDIENGDEYVSYPDSTNIVFSLFDNYLEYYFYPRVLTANYIVSKCEQTNCFIIFEKTTGTLKYIIALDEDLFEEIEMYGFNEQTDMLTVWSEGKLRRFKVVLSDKKAVEDLHNKYMSAYEADKRCNLKKKFEFDRLFFKAVDSCEICELSD